jgi:hypothetical protein
VKAASAVDKATSLCEAVIVPTRDCPSMSASETTKQRWFAKGEESLRRLSGDLAARLGEGVKGAYVCPLCVRPFSLEALGSGELTAEHVPPDKLGGRPLVLTCRKCNNEAGTQADAHAVARAITVEAMAGRLDRKRKAKATVGDVTANVFINPFDQALTVLEARNAPGTLDRLRETARPGATVSVEYIEDRFDELSARVSFLRAAYLVLFAVFGYPVVADPALDIVRAQIANPKQRIIECFLALTPESAQSTQKQLARVLEPHLGWLVQFGPWAIALPHCGDRDFYSRLQPQVGTLAQLHCESYEWPTEPLFGLDLLPADIG